MRYCVGSNNVQGGEVGVFQCDDGNKWADRASWRSSGCTLRRRWQEGSVRWKRPFHEEHRHEDNMKRGVDMNDDDSAKNVELTVRWYEHVEGRRYRWPVGLSWENTT